MQLKITCLIRCILPLYILLFVLFLGISWVSYPNYNFTENDISALGKPSMNPDGWIFWSIGMIITGLINLFLVVKIKNKMISDYGKTGKLSVILLFLAGYGIIGLGIVPQLGGITYFVHIFHASLGFGGLYLGTWFMINSFSKEEKTKKQAYLMLVLGVGVPICFLIFQGIKISLYTVKNPGIWYLNFSFWEWNLLFGIFLAYLILVYTILRIIEIELE